MAKTNCWEFKKCGRQPGGAKAHELGVCAASVDTATDGVNGGKHGGRICWAVTGTLCGGKVQGTFARKIGNCLLDCPFFKSVMVEEKKKLDLYPPKRSPTCPDNGLPRPVSGKQKVLA